ncbi:MAG TPA: UDP-2,3-diacylglucosamine diphosphatase [Rhodocyclaceae bacterium]|jgi:UDP-2,3-diacylglucosamine hydrolase|nr:UDP-2,3-diacylglucosamine diphosphatase [Rhodocyclaceae bacterium]
MTVLFASDLHLCEERPVLTGLFLDFLQHVVPGHEALYLLGDVFEYWAGDDDLADPFNTRICTAIKACDLPKYVLPGNRDFLFGTAFEAATGSQLLPDEIVHDIAGTPTLLLHGDTLCTDDVAYQDFRRMVRNPDWQKNFLALPLAARKAQIEAARRNSEEQKQQKSMAIMDVNLNAVSDAFRRHGVQTMIHGHTHRLASHYYDIDGKKCVRHVLGDWHENANGGNYMACSPEGWQRCIWWPLPE